MVSVVPGCRVCVMGMLLAMASGVMASSVPYCCMAMSASVCLFFMVMVMVSWDGERRDKGVERREGLVRSHGFLLISYFMTKHIVMASMMAMSVRMVRRLLVLSVFCVLVVAFCPMMTASESCVVCWARLFCV